MICHDVVCHDVGRESECRQVTELKNGTRKRCTGQAPISAVVTNRRLLTYSHPQVSHANKLWSPIRLNKPQVHTLPSSTIRHPYPVPPMSAFRTLTATKHIRTLSQPLRRTFYSPFAALQQPSLSTTKSPSSAAHEHEHEHTSRTLHVVSEPHVPDVKYGVPIGAFPNSAPFHPTPGSEQVSTHENVSASSISSVGRSLMTRYGIQ